MEPFVRILPDADALARAAAEEFVSRARSSVEAKGTFVAALSGGHTPRRAYELLGGTEARGRVDWRRTKIFLVDERHVPYRDPDSNYRMIHEALTSGGALPPGCIERYETEGDDPAAIARDGEERLREYFRLGPGELPRFDLVLLGMGADGHTASIFPGTTAVDERERLVAAVRVEKLDTWRFTLTLPVIDHAAAVVFLVSGSGKAATLRTVLREPGAGLPAQRVRPVGGPPLWLVDRAAASALER